MPKIKEGIISLLNLHSAPDATEIALSNRQSMTEQLKGLYSNEFLEGLNDDQIYDLFEEMILLPQLQHIKLEKPLKPRPDSNIYDLPVYDKWWLIKPKPEEDEEV